MKAAIYLLLVMMSQGCTTSPPKTANPYMQARATTVLVNNLKGSIGTGNVVNDKCVLTAAHVADQDIVDLVTASDKEFIAMRVAHDEAEDIAVVCTTVALDSPPVSIGPDPLLTTLYSLLAIRRGDTSSSRPASGKTTTR